MWRRVRRIFLEAVTVASLLLCVAAAGAWVWSYWRHAHVGFVRGGLTFQFQSVEQTLHVQTSSGPLYPPTPWEGGPAGFTTPWSEFLHFDHGVLDNFFGRPREYRFVGFVFRPTYVPFPDHTGAKVTYTIIGVPYYFIFWTAAILPFVRLRRALRRRRLRRLAHLTRCPACGYDCRASPDRCPECGTPRRILGDTANARAAG